MSDIDPDLSLHDYQPCLRDVGEDWRDRWVVLREFIRNWFWIRQENRSLRREIDAVETWGAPVASVEKRIGVALPPSLKEWVSLFEQTNSEHGNLMRDDYAMLWSENSQTLVIRVICEGNVAWGVKRADLHLPDPPVQEMDVCVYGDDDVTWRGNQWESKGMIRPTVTAFLIKQILDYLPSKTRVDVSVPEEPARREERLAQMSQYFDRVSTIGNDQLFESTNMFAGLQPGSRVCSVHFRKRRPQIEELPDWIRQNTRDSRYRI